MTGSPSAVPRVSVVLPNYNYARYVGETIDSLLGQSLGAEALEVIVVDDASTDDSLTVLARYAGDPRVRVVRHERNTGYVAAYNEGMALARGAYIVSMDADDLALDPRALEIQAAILDRDPDVGLVLANFYVIDENGRRLATRSVDVPDLMPRPEGARRLLLRNFIMHSGVMIRREAIADGAHDPRFFHSMDWELWLRIGAKYALAHVREHLYGYRTHSSNMHRSVDREAAMRERLLLIETGSAVLGLSATSPLRRHALANGYVDRALMHTSRGEYGFGLADLRAAAEIAPRALLSRPAMLSLAHVASGVLPRSWKSRILRRLRLRRRG